MNKIAYLQSALNAWNTDSFSSILIDELMSLEAYVMPLQQGLTQGDLASEKPTKITVLSTHEAEKDVIINLAVFFTEIISGCSCGDDPVVINGYCEMKLTINKISASGLFQVTS